MGSTAAIDRIPTDDIGPGQRFVAMEVCSRILDRDNEVIVHWPWAPAHHGVTGNERMDECAKVAAEGKIPSDEVPDKYRWETSLSHEQGPRRVSVSCDCPVDLQPCRTRAWIQRPPG